MKKVILTMMVIALLLLTACGNNAEPATNDGADEDVQHAATQVEIERAAEDNVALDQELVNFKCVIADLQTIYFLKNKAKISSEVGDSWIIDETVYIKMTLDGEDYLIKYPAMERNDIDREGMIATYHNSKAVSNIDCEMNVVKESDVALPDLEILSDEELQAKMMEGMMPEGMDLP